MHSPATPSCLKMPLAVATIPPPASFPAPPESCMRTLTTSAGCTNSQPLTPDAMPTAKLTCVGKGAAAAPAGPVVEVDSIAAVRRPGGGDAVAIVLAGMAVELLAGFGLVAVRSSGVGGRFEVAQRAKEQR